MPKYFLRIVIPVAIALFSIPAFAADEKDYTYLALGDSVAFRFDPTLLPNATPYSFVGYPEVVAQLTRRLIVNASCPGQSSLSFLAGGSDMGCDGFKQAIGLRAPYTGKQVDFAVAELLGNKKIDLVTLSIGGNDLSLLQARCQGTGFVACVEAGLPAVLAEYGHNLRHILISLRSTGKYRGDLVLVKYYSPSADPLFRRAVGALNQVMSDVGAIFNTKLADGFSAFYFASVSSDGDPCAAGLLIRLSDTSCDIHPSPKGRLLLAAAVMFALNTNERKNDD